MKKETFAEFLARGGKVTIIPAGQSTLNKQPPIKPESVKFTTTRNTINGENTPIISIEDAEHYYGEFKPRKAKKTSNAIDLSVHLPEALRKKYVDGIVKAKKEDEE